MARCSPLCARGNRSHSSGIVRPPSLPCLIEYRPRPLSSTVFLHPGFFIPPSFFPPFFSFPHKLADHLLRTVEEKFSQPDRIVRLTARVKGSNESHPALLTRCFHFPSLSASFDIITEIMLGHPHRRPLTSSWRIAACIVAPGVGLLGNSIVCRTSRHAHYLPRRVSLNIRANVPPFVPP